MTPTIIREHDKAQRRITPLLTGLALLAALGTTGCGSDSKSESSADAGGDAEGSAILVGVFVRNPDGRNVYVGAVPEIPSGELDYSEYLEFGSVDVGTHGGYVFVWDREPATMTRFDVTADLQLEAGPTLSFLDKGVSGSARTVYVSANRAYTLSPALDLIVIWDPETMEITGEIEMVPPVRAEGLSTSAADGHVAGDSVIWPLVSTNFDGVSHFAGAAVAIASASTDAPVQIVEDERCVGGDGAHVDAAGDFYLRAGGYWGSAAAYGAGADQTRTCVLRINSGEVTFDPDFLVDIKDLTGTYVNFPWYHVEGSQYLAHAWDSATPFPESIDDYWDGAGLKPLLVDVETGDSVPYPDLEGQIVVSSSEFELDGTSYYQLSGTGTAVGGSADIVALTPDGIVTAFTLPELWALARIR